MRALDSKVDAQAEDFALNDAANRALAKDLRAVKASICEGGSERARAKHSARGKLLARDRIAA